MITIIAGSREGFTYRDIEDACFNCGWTITKVISGGARGVDKLGAEYANNNQIPLSVWLADWDRYGKTAGYKRNVKMAQNSEALIACWDGVSRGTRHMIEIAQDFKLKIYIYQRKDNREF